MDSRWVRDRVIRPRRSQRRARLAAQCSAVGGSRAGPFGAVFVARSTELCLESSRTMHTWLLGAAETALEQTLPPDDREKARAYAQHELCEHTQTWAHEPLH